MTTQRKAGEQTAAWSELQHVFRTNYTTGGTGHCLSALVLVATLIRRD